MRHKGKKNMYVNMFVKNIGISRMVESWESQKKHATCVTIEIDKL